MSSTKPVVKKSEFIKLAEKHTKAYVAQHYGLPLKDVTSIAGQLKVTFKKRKEDNFIIEDDTNDDVRPAEEANKYSTADTIFEEASKIEEPSNITNTEIEVKF